MRAVRDFFLSDQLGRVSPLARLLYIGLHLLADDKDLIPYRPKWIGVQILPYDQVDTASLLDELVDEQLIEYKGEGGEVIQLLPYWKHEHKPINQKRPIADRQAPIMNPPQFKAPGPTSGALEWLEPEKVEELKKMAAECTTVKELVKRMGITYASYYHWRSKYPEFAALTDEITADMRKAKQDRPKRKYDSRTIVFKQQRAEQPQAQEKELKVTVLPPAVAPTPEKPLPGFRAWLEEPAKAAQLREWAEKRLSTSEIAKRMGVPVEKLVQWKVMSNEFAALLSAPSRKGRNLS